MRYVRVTSDPRGRVRFDAADYIKALAILAVVAQHTHRFRWFLPAGETESFLRGYLLCFHVPSFLLVSGFLYASERVIEWSEVRRRLARVLVPYVIASLLAQQLGLARQDGRVLALYQLASGSALGIYYFVPILVSFILLSRPLSRCGTTALALWFALSLAYVALIGWFPILHPSAAYGAFVRRIPFLGLSEPAWTAASFFEMRNPLHMAAFFLAGWLVRLVQLRRPGLASRCRAFILAPALAALAACAWYLTAPRPELFTVYRFLYTLGIAGLCVVLAAHRPPGRAVLFLAGTTFTIYLFHHFFQIPLSRVADDWSPLARVPFLFAGGLSGGVAVAWLARRALGETNARRWLGA